MIIHTVIHCCMGGLKIDEHSAVLGSDSCWSAWFYTLGDRAESGETLVEAGSEIGVQMVPWSISPQGSSG